MNIAERLWRRVRYGNPIIVVSGLPRSGTSMMMNMLLAGGVPLLTDGIRSADRSNPRGYFEFERVKELNGNGELSWLPSARGKAVKVVSFLLTRLPETFNYRVIFMQRDLGEIIASQNQMLTARGEPGPPGDFRTRQVYADHLEQVARLLARRPCFRSLLICYNDTVDDPRGQAQRIGTFLDRSLDVERMVAIVDSRLYRIRSGIARTP
jgi:hypothetical protein